MSHSEEEEKKCVYRYLLTNCLIDRCISLLCPVRTVSRDGGVRGGSSDDLSLYHVCGVLNNLNRSETEENCHFVINFQRAATKRAHPCCRTCFGAYY